MKIKWESPDIKYNEIKASFEEEDEDLEEELQNIGHLIATPFGLFSVDDPFTPMKRTELRIGYTDFPITDEEFKIINDCPGVDTFRVMSRYSFIIGIGKAFEFTSVRRDLEKSLGCNEENELSGLIKALGKKQYAILIMPNGVYKVTTEDDENYEYNLIAFKEIKEKVNGKLILSP